MKNLRFKIISALLAAVFFISPVQAQRATWEEAAIVANNWITRIIQREGNWGGYDSAQIADMQEFTRNGRTIGYFFKVEPVGFIIVSLRKELAPVKAYSTESNLDPNSEVGMADLLKTKMEGILDALEQPLRLYDTTELLLEQGFLEIDYRPAWDELCGQVRYLAEEPAYFFESDSTTQVGPLLTTNWHQDHPYNLFCPVGDSSCSDCCPDDGDPSMYCPPSNRTAVGCVATAAAQIMKYWNWPPYGIGSNSYYWDGDISCPAGGGGRSGADAQTLSADFSDDYGWLNMPDTLTESSNQTQINAIANLCYEIGVAVDANYGVCETISGIFDMNDAYGDHFRYNTYGVVGRADNRSRWADIIKEQLKSNFPIHYRFIGHQLVLDGWREDGGISMRQYHMNYGYGRSCDETNGCNTWYSLDALYRSTDPDKEKMIAYVYPTSALGNRLIDNWTYVKEQFSYRYFVQDANGVNVTFAAGQNLQFLPRVRVKCISGNISFKGTSSDNTRLFSIKGTNKAEILIKAGAIMLHPGGGIRFH